MAATSQTSENSEGRDSGANGIENDEFGQGGSARLMSEHEIAEKFPWTARAAYCGLHPSAGFLLGAANAQGNPDERHMLTVAGIGGGKSRTVVMPALAMWGASAVVTDPSGEIYSATKRYRVNASYSDRSTGEERKTLILFDPFGVTDEISARFNPLLDLATDDDLLLYTRMKAIARQVCPMPAGVDDPFWIQAGQGLALSLLLHMMTATIPVDGALKYAGGKGRAERRTLGMLRELILKACAEKPIPKPSPKATAKELDDYEVKILKSLRYELAQNPWNNGRIAARAEAYFNLDEKPRSSVNGTLEAATEFLDAPRIDEQFATSDFSMRDLFRRDDVTLYLVISDMEAARTWVRVLLQTAFRIFQDEAHKDEAGKRLSAEDIRAINPCLFILDEFGNMGRFDEVTRAADELRKFGVRLWPIIQSIPQIRNNYGSRYESLISGAGVIQFFSPGYGDSSAQYISNLIGLHWSEYSPNVRERVALDGGHIEFLRPARPDTPEVKRQKSQLITPEELAKYLDRETGKMLLLRNGGGVALVNRLDWSRFKQQFLQNV